MLGAAPVTPASPPPAVGTRSTWHARQYVRGPRVRSVRCAQRCSRHGALMNIWAPTRAKRAERSAIFDDTRARTARALVDIRDPSARSARSAQQYLRTKAHSDSRAPIARHARGDHEYSRARAREARGARRTKLAGCFAVKYSNPNPDPLAPKPYTRALMLAV